MCGVLPSLHSGFTLVLYKTLLMYKSCCQLTNWNNLLLPDYYNHSIGFILAYIETNIFRIDSFNNAFLGLDSRGLIGLFCGACTITAATSSLPYLVPFLGIMFSMSYRKSGGSLSGWSKASRRSKRWIQPGLKCRLARLMPCCSWPP